MSVVQGRTTRGVQTDFCFKECKESMNRFWCGFRSGFTNRLESKGGITNGTLLFFRAQPKYCLLHEAFLLLMCRTTSSSGLLYLFSSLYSTPFLIIENILLQAFRVPLSERGISMLESRLTVSQNPSTQNSGKSQFAIKSRHEWERQWGARLVDFVLVLFCELLF